MAISRGYSQAQFRDVVMGAIGPNQIDVAISSTSSGAFTTVAGVAVPGAAVGDLLFAKLVTPTAGVTVEAEVTAANTVSIIVFNISGSTYNPGTVPLVFVGFRPRTS